uniref:C-type lectin domain-containing protein n=1 Tax=Knipowitschia caucasica TaxID=637954 RepID=A0AAV2LSF1_KNICA
MEDMEVIKERTHEKTHGQEDADGAVLVELKGLWLKSTLQTDALQISTLQIDAQQIHIWNLTEERDQINSSYVSVMKELDQTKDKMASTAAVSCADGWRLFGFKCYYLSQISYTWSNARRQCYYQGADLVVIEGRDEMVRALPASSDRTSLGYTTQ